MRRDLALLTQAGCHVTIATMTPGDCGSVDHDAETICRRPEARGEGGGRSDRRRLRLPGIPRPGDLQRRRLATAGRRGLRRARPDLSPDRPAGRLPLRPRGDQPPRPRRLLHRDGYPTTRPASGSRLRPLPKIPHLYYMDALEGSGPRRPPANPPGSYVDVSKVADDQAADARLPRQPARLAPEAARDRRVPRQPRPRWGAHRGQEIGVAHAEAFRQYLGHAVSEGEIGCWTCSGKMTAPGAIEWARLEE